MSKGRIRLRSGIASTLALAFICGLAFFLRFYYSRKTVFAGDHVNFQGIDAWYHMRLVENLVHHFPHRINFDPYALYPSGQDMAIGPFFDWLIAAFILLIKPHSPSKELVGAVGAYVPAVLGALLAIPVYFIGTELFNRIAGLIAAALVAILPGGMVAYSLLGSTDHHIAETFFTALAMLFLILAVKRSDREAVSFARLRRGSSRAFTMPTVYSLLAGLSLGCYLLTWMRGAFLVFVILAWVIIQCIIDHLKGRKADYLCIVGIPCFLIALLMVLPFLGRIRYVEYHVQSLLGGLLAIPVLTTLSLVMSRTKLKPVLFPIAVVTLIAAGLSAVYFVAPSIVKAFLGEAARFMPRGTALTVAEVRPLLYMTGTFSLALAWVRFTTSFFLAFISLPIIAYFVIRQGAADKSLLLVWSVAMLLAALGQNRFTYYFVVNAALLTAYLSTKMLEWGGVREGVEKLSRKEEHQNGSGDFIRSRLTSANLTRALAILAVFFAVFYPNIVLAVKAGSYDLGPDRDWYEALVWMRSNTPEPFDDPDYYYASYQRPQPGESYRYPGSAYGVMSWWDYGYWIIDIARRIPNANPTQGGSREAALFFTAQDEASANQWLDKLGSRYVIADGQLPMWHIPGDQYASGKFPTMTTWAEKSASEFFEEYQQKTLEGNLVPVFLYYPEYYRTMLSRLYLFEGKAVVPQNSTWVISYAEKTNERGQRYKEISTALRFATFEEAKSYLETQTMPNQRLVGMNPLASCVPLEELKSYKLIHKSPTTKFSASKQQTPMFSPVGEISNVGIFEYVKP